MAQGGSKGLLAPISTLRTDQNTSTHGLTNYIDSNAKCHFKKVTFKGRRLSESIDCSGDTVSHVIFDPAL